MIAIKISSGKAGRISWMAHSSVRVLVLMGDMVKFLMDNVIRYTGKQAYVPSEFSEPHAVKQNAKQIFLSTLEKIRI